MQRHAEAIKRSTQAPKEIEFHESSDGGATWPLSRQVLGVSTSCGDDRSVIGFFIGQALPKLVLCDVKTVHLERFLCFRATW